MLWSVRTRRTRLSWRQRLAAVADRRRIIAATLAFAMNVVLFGALMLAPSVHDGRVPERDLEVISLTLVGAPPVQRVLPDPPEPKRDHDRVHAAKSHNDTPINRGPPTETAASLAPPIVKEGEAQLSDGEELARRCREAHPETLAAAESQAIVGLRVFVTPDGRIAQGSVAVSSGDEDLDRAAFQCVQALANLEPTVVDGNPIGSWQNITTHWGRQ